MRKGKMNTQFIKHPHGKGQGKQKSSPKETTEWYDEEGIGS